MPKMYELVYGYPVTYNAKERTWTIYSPSGDFISTVNDGELLEEIQSIKSE